MCILYLQTGSEFEEKVSNMLYACEEKEEQLSVSHGVFVVFLSEGGGAGERKRSAKE